VLHYRGWKGLQGTNALAYCAHLKTTINQYEDHQASPLSDAMFYIHQEKLTYFFTNICITWLNIENCGNIYGVKGAFTLARFRA
jgi:hypothetical protein